MATFSIIVPAHNELENLRILLPRLYETFAPLGDEFEILLVDNASTDNTPALVAEFQKKMPQLHLVSAPTLGYGRAVLAGMRAATGAYLGTIRADNQEKSADLLEIFNRAKAGNYMLYKAVRAHRINDGVKRIIISFFFNTLFTVLFFTRSHDLNASPKVLSRAFYEQAHLESADWFLDAEIVLKAERLGYPVGEMSIEYLPRLKGKSTVRMRHIFEFLRNMLQWRLRLWRGDF